MLRFTTVTTKELRHQRFLSLHFILYIGIRKPIFFLLAGSTEYARQEALLLFAHSCELYKVFLFPTLAKPQIELVRLFLKSDTKFWFLGDLSFDTTKSTSKTLKKFKTSETL
jgi:hypothetical protein